MLTLRRVGEESPRAEPAWGAGDGAGLVQGRSPGINTPTGNLHHLANSRPAPGTGQILAQLTALSVPLTGWRPLEAATNYRIL